MPQRHALKLSHFCIKWLSFDSVWTKSEKSKTKSDKIIHFSFFTFHFSLFVVCFFLFTIYRPFLYLFIVITLQKMAINPLFCRAALFTLITKRPCVFYSNFTTITCLRTKNSPVNSSHSWVIRQRIWVSLSWPSRTNRPATRATKPSRCKTMSAWNTSATRFWARS